MTTALDPDLKKLRSRAFARTEWAEEVLIGDPFHGRQIALRSCRQGKGFMAEIFPNEQVTLEPDEESKTLTVSVQTPEGKLDGQFTIEPPEEKAPKPTFLPFLVCRVGDPGLAWVFGRVETFSEPEARIALNSAEEEFWQTKKGLKLMKKTQRTFEAFVEHVPAGLLTNKGLKRHYKTFGIILLA